MMEPSEVNRAFDVLGCPRCGEDHPAREFFHRTDVNGMRTHPAWWSLCPVTGDTLALVTDRDGIEVAAAID